MDFFDCVSLRLLLLFVLFVCVCVCMCVCVFVCGCLFLIIFSPRLYWPKGYCRWLVCLLSSLWLSLYICRRSRLSRMSLNPSCLQDCCGGCGYCLDLKLEPVFDKSSFKRHTRAAKYRSSKKIIANISAVERSKNV